jgi:hypothetical protein
MHFYLYIKYKCIIFISLLTTLKTEVKMGQYYRAVNIDNKQAVSPYGYGNGAKLMEHSWLTNNFVNKVEILIAEFGDWYGNRIVWAGDYAEVELNDPENRNLYDMVDDDECLKLPDIKKAFRYLINLDKKLYVDYKKVPITDTWINPKNGQKRHYRIHPLPLLTCEGNGGGGGDYYGEDTNEIVGTWARDRITVSTEKPSDDFKLMEFKLVEK